MDKLDEIFQKQKEFQDRVGSHPYMNKPFIKDMILASVDELMETLREMSWKPWSKKEFFNVVKFKEELVDVMHFFVNLCLSVGMTSIELYDRYIIKNKINHKRQDEGY